MKIQKSRGEEREMKFTKDEIVLCKKITEKHRKEIEYGDWIKCGDEQFIFVSEYKGLIVVYSEGGYDLSHRILRDEIIPLWQISDCLEFLRENNYILRLPYQSNILKRGMEFSECLVDGKEKKEVFINGSDFMEKPLEALLKAVLAILEEGK